MKFRVRQSVAVPPQQAVRAYGLPAFYESRPSRDDIAVLGVVRHDDAGSRIHIEVRFAFTGSVSPAVRAVIDPDKMSWVTKTEVLPEEGRTVWEVLPDHYPDRLDARGTYRFTQGDDGPASTIVEVDGQFNVRVPIVGRSVERVIVSGLRAYIEDEVSSIPDLAR